MLIIGVIHIALMQGIMYKLYKITIDKKTLKMLIISILFVLISFVVSDFDGLAERYLIGLVVISISLWYSTKHFHDVTNLNIFDFIKMKLKRKS